MSASSPKASASSHDFLNQIVKIFLESKLSLILVLFSLLVGAAALLATPREEDPQIIVPLADIFVHFPGRSAAEVEQHVSTPLERILYQIDGVEHVYSMSRTDQAIITVRFFVGQDRERSLVKLFKKLQEHQDQIPPGVTGWVMKPVEIDDVPILTLTLRGAASAELRRLGEELVERLASIPDVSRAYVVGGEPRVVRVELDPERLAGYSVSPLDVQRALQAANRSQPAGEFTRQDLVMHVEAGTILTRPEQVAELVVGVFDGRPVFLKDVATVRACPDEVTSYVRHGWGPGRGFGAHPGSPGTTLIGSSAKAGSDDGGRQTPVPAVTIALAKKKGTNAVRVARDLLDAAERLGQAVLPAGVEMVVTRNYGLTANDKVNELIEALGLAILIVLALLTLSLGWRAAFVVAVAIPVVFGLTLAVNLLFGYSINRVTLFALILSLGLLVDDPIVDVENIARHFEERKKATHEIVLQAVAEIRPPLISATLAVIVSFLPLFFITGMMGPYMAPMALNVPVSMMASMLVAFTITPWLSYVVLRRQYADGSGDTKGSSQAASAASGSGDAEHGGHGEVYDPELLRQTLLYKVFRPLMAPLLTSRSRAIIFLLIVAALTVAAVGMAAVRWVPLKMLPFDNKNELLLVLDFDEGTTLERASAAVQDFEAYLATVPEVTDYTSYVGTHSPIDFNGLVRHYYLRQAPHLAEIRVDLVGKHRRHLQSHALGLRLRNDLTRLAERHQARLKIVELPPGPPVLASIVAEVTGGPQHTYEDLLRAADAVRARFEREPGMVDVDDMREAAATKLVFTVDQEKAALAGVTVAEISDTIRLALSGWADETLRVARERQPLRLVVRLPRALRSSDVDLSRIHVRGSKGQLIALAELGRWSTTRVDQTIYHKDLQRITYVLGETAGRPPADCIIDLLADLQPQAQLREQPNVQPVGNGLVSTKTARPVAGRTFFANGSGIPWSVPEDIQVDFTGEGEWDITLDVFRDLGLAFGAAMIMIYIILVAQTGSFMIPIVVMLAIPLTVLGVMPGFYLLNALFAGEVGGYPDPVFFTATGMIGMIALAGIVTRDAIILVDFIEQTRRRGRPMFDAIMESRVVRLRPILLTAGAAMLSSIPITLDPIFSGLGWSLIFGLFASTLFTLFVIPVAYWLVYARRSS